MFVDVKNYKLFKSFLNTPQEKFATIEDLVAYQQKSFQNEIFETESKRIGHEELAPLRIPIKISKRVEKDKIPDPKRTIMGVSFGFSDNVTNIFSFTSKGDPVEAKPYKDGF